MLFQRWRSPESEDVHMARFANELIESMRKAAEHAANEKACKKIKQHGRRFATAELSDERVQEIGSSRMDERHAHLDSILRPK
jgi:ATP/maltotriose-dependent transcriptional regulator MalT